MNLLNAFYCVIEERQRMRVSDDNARQESNVSERRVRSGGNKQARNETGHSSSRRDRLDPHTSRRFYGCQGKFNRY